MCVMKAFCNARRVAEDNAFHVQIRVPSLCNAEYAKATAKADFYPRSSVPAQVLESETQVMSWGYATGAPRNARMHCQCRVLVFMLGRKLEGG